MPLIIETTCMVIMDIMVIDFMMIMDIIVIKDNDNVYPDDN